MKIDHKDMETIESFKSIYQAYLESNLTVRDLVMQTDYIQADETTVPIVDDEKYKTVKGYLWQVCSVMYTMMGCCKIAGVNVEEWLTYSSKSLKTTSLIRILFFKSLSDILYKLIMYIGKISILLRHQS